jgi:hypothetical protein
MKITIIVEGKTEKAFRPHLRNFLAPRLAGQMPRLDMYPYDGRIPTHDKLKRVVERLLSDKPLPSDAVIALTDVYTGTGDFINASDAKNKMRSWVGSNSRFYPHTAQHDFEAWLLPYWDEIKQIAGHNKGAPGGSPEQINHDRPPSFYIKEIFEIGNCRDSYSKVRDANRILQGKDLAVAAAKCPELKEFLNTILGLGGAAPL